MSKIKSSISVIFGAFLISSGLNCNPSFAANIQTWNLKFFNDNNELIGTGELSYDLDTTTFIQTNSIINNEGENPPEGFYVRTALTDFSATLTLPRSFPEEENDFRENTWILSDANESDYYSVITWWYDPSAPVPFGESFLNSYDYDLVPEIHRSWWFGSRDGGSYTVLTMGIGEPLTNQVWQGGWTGGIDVGSYYDEGTWTATLATIPEPLTLLGTGTALGFGFLFKRKISK